MGSHREIQNAFVLLILLGTLTGSSASAQSTDAALSPAAKNELRFLLTGQLPTSTSTSGPSLPSVPQPLEISQPVPPTVAPTETFSTPPASGPIDSNPSLYDDSVVPSPLNPATPSIDGEPNVPGGMISPSAYGNCCPCQGNYACQRFSLSPAEAAARSLCGDVYAPGSWRPLDFGDFFSDGWDEAWAGGPAGGEGLTPRHGWLGANDGVFYRLWLNTFSYVNHVPIGNGLHANSYVSDFSIFLPLNRRLEVLIDTPYLVSGSTSNLSGGIPTTNTYTQFGDVIVTPRLLLQESQRVSQVFALGVETPTGLNTLPSGGHTSLTPRYEFWTNPVGAWVARGGLGTYVPLNNNQTLGTAMTGNFAVGRYLTSHNALLGDLVVYGASSFTSSFTTGSPTSVSIGPGTRFHVGNNWFVLGFANFYLAHPQPGNYLTQVALMKVF